MLRAVMFFGGLAMVFVYPPVGVVLIVLAVCVG